MRPSIARELRAAIMTAATFAVASMLGFLLLVALFKVGVAAGIDILFYRGLVLCALAFVLTVAVVAVAGRYVAGSLSNAIAAGTLSLGLNLSFLVIAPVTVDRSISVFLLGHMARDPQHALTAADLEAAFRDIYLGDLKQIARRVREQERSGNVVRSGDGYVLTAQGAAFVRSARGIGWLFDADPRLLDPSRGPAETTAASR